MRPRLFSSSLRTCPGHLWIWGPDARRELENVATRTALLGRLTETLVGFFNYWELGSPKSVAEYRQKLGSFHVSALQTSAVYALYDQIDVSKYSNATKRNAILAQKELCYKRQGAKDYELELLNYYNVG